MSQRVLITAGAAGIVFLLGWRRSFEPVTMVVSGLLVGITAASVSAALTLAQGEYLMSLVVWNGGSLSQQDWSNALSLAFQLVAGLVLTGLLIKPLTVLGLGDAGARSLGVSLFSIRLAVAAVAVMLAAFVASAVGLVSFIGLAAPALTRALGVRRSSSVLLVSPLLGGLLLWFCDGLVQLLASTTAEVFPTGAVTALIGGPLLLWLLPKIRPTDVQRGEGVELAKRRRLTALLPVLAVMAGLVFAALAIGKGPDGWTVLKADDLQSLLPFRWPRLVAAVAAGGLLAMAGALLQRLTGNPMASPEVIGVSGGAGLGFAAAITIFPAAGLFELFCGAGIGSAAVMILVLLFSMRRHLAPEKILLAGIAISSLCSAVLSALLAIGDQRAWQILAWLSGSGSTATPASAIFLAILSVVLLAGAGLLLRSFQRLVAVDPGFDPERLLTMQVWLPVPNDNAKGRYFSQEQRVGFYDRAVAAVRQVPGVTGVALVSRLPYGRRADARFKIEGRPVSDAQLLPSAEVRLVSPDYFRTMAIPVLQGEAMPDGVDSLSSTYALVNRTLAEREWKGQSPIGQRLQLVGFGRVAFADRERPSVTIVGVVNDVRQGAPDQPPLPEFYLSYRLLAGQEMSLVVRTAGDPDALADRVVRSIRSVDPTQPVFGVKSMTRLLANAEAERRFSLLLLSLFAAIALLLSSLGIYGVMAYSTSQRRHEIGIRMALGAATPDVLRLVLRQGMRLVLLGLAIGLFGAWGLSRVLAGQLYGISARDPFTYAAVALLLGTVAFAATWLPARRATRVDPMISLRSE